MSVCHKDKPDGPVLDPTETNPQGSRQDFMRIEVFKSAYHDVTRGVHI